MIVLTVYFADPWWVGVLECAEAGELRAARYVFGAEPGGPEVLELVLQRWDFLVARLSAAPVPQTPQPVARSPKRAARAAARALGERGPSTAAQEALRLEREAHKRERAVLSRAERERIAATKWQKHVAKQQARRRGH